MAHIFGQISHPSSPVQLILIARHSELPIFTCACVTQKLPIFTRVAHFHKSCLFSQKLPIFTRVAYFHLRLCHIFAFSCDQYVIIITCLAWRNGQSFSSVSVSMRAPEFGPASPRTWRGKFLSHMFKNVFRSSTHKHMSYLIHYILK